MKNLFILSFFISVSFSLCFAQGRITAGQGSDNGIVIHDRPGARFLLATGGWKLSFLTEKLQGNDYVAGEWEPRITFHRDGIISAHALEVRSRITAGQGSDNGIVIHDRPGARFLLSTGGWKLSFLTEKLQGNDYVAGEWEPRITFHRDGIISAYALKVKGGIEAQEIVVHPNVEFPDYVFHDNYQLMPLSELEEKIKKDKHLPGIPSEKEIKKEGISLVKMNVGMLKKIEELTLYTIQQNKTIQEQKSRIQAQNLKIKTLEEKYQDLDKQMAELRQIILQRDN